MAQVSCNSVKLNGKIYLNELSQKYGFKNIHSRYRNTDNNAWTGSACGEWV
jgi:hypothetical protein